MNYGATPEEWAHWDLVEGLGADLLPVVCRPNQNIYEHSNLKVYGKVPSRYTVRREVVGFTNWTTHVATELDRDSWAKQLDYGICLQTRRVRALDFDITDHDYAEYVRDCLAIFGYLFPWRTRANASKFLTLLRIEGDDDYGKQVLKTPHGAIEFLATGQQCVVAGTHPSGARYQWDWRHPIPTFRPDEVETLLQCLAGIVNATRSGESVSWSKPARSRVVERAATGATIDDPVVHYLQLSGLALRSTQDGRIYVACPWVDSHTSDSDLTATCWFPAGTAGYELGHFKCLHAHCQEREDWEFLAAIGYQADGFEIIGPRSERASDAGRVDGGESAGGVREGLGHDGFDIIGPRNERTDRTALPNEQSQDYLQRDQAAAVDRSATDFERVDGDDRGSSSAEIVRGTHSNTAAKGEGSYHSSHPSGVLQALGAHTAPKRIVSASLDHPLFERNAETGKIKPKLPNIVLAFQRPDLIGAVLGWDEFKAEVAWKDWQLGRAFDPAGGWQEGTRPLKDSDYVSLHLALAKLGFGPSGIPTELIRQAVTWIAEQRAFDSAINWIDHLPAWDGTPRIETFCSTYLGTDDSPYTRAVARYWWTGHVARILVPGVQADMAMVLISEQGTRKTSLLRYLPPYENQFVELDLNERDDDLSRKMRGKLIGEMAELKGINSKDIESVKAWVSRRHEEWVPKFQEFSRTFPRRLLLVGTTNQEEFLADETGNRRWLPMRVGRQDIPAMIRDRIQLWAEAVALYLTYGLCYADAERLAKEEHLQYMIHDEWQHTIQGWLFQDDGLSGRPADREFLVMGDVLRGALGLANHQENMSTQFRVGRILRKLGYAKFHKRIDGEFHKVWIKATLRWQHRKNDTP